MFYLNLFCNLPTLLSSLLPMLWTWNLASNCRKRMEQWTLMTSELASSLWDMTWYGISNVDGAMLSVAAQFSVCCILQIYFTYSFYSPSMPFSGRGWVCPYNDACRPQWYWNRLLPVFHWLYDQRDGWYRHCRAGCGILPDPGRWQGMCVWLCWYGLLTYAQIFLADTILFQSFPRICHAKLIYDLQFC